mmetsp:Transcript_33539/g.115360  ORF Transcript_33539/g.115360 Transcript_33539/m.115360 type:complete len:766 (-) Transcript_33539:67-2364(-)
MVPPQRQWWWQKKAKTPGTLILVRHGESLWNENSTFTGWADVDLSQRGEREIEHAARLLLEAGFKIDVAYTSRLKRAIRSTWIVLRELDQIYTPVYKSWRMNERMYGALTGLSKPALALELGEAKVQSYRHGLYDRPPPMPADGSHAYWPGRERKYDDLAAVPRTESLYDTMQRSLPLWEARILPDLRAGLNVMIVAHGNSLRALIKEIDSIDDEAITRVRIPNGIPLIYKFAIEDPKEAKLKDPKGLKRGKDPKALKRASLPRLTPLKLSTIEGSPLSGEFLEKKGLLRAALLRESELWRKIPGYDASIYSSPSMRALSKLEMSRKLIELVGDTTALAEPNGAEAKAADDSADNGVDAMYMMGGTPVAAPDEGPLANEATPQSARGAHYRAPAASVSRPDRATKWVGPVVIIVRHGKTEHNKLGLFTGWEDAPLAADGVAEAAKAGVLLREHGFEVDVVFTSWLSRAIETAWLVLAELDSLWVPIVKTWRLNERMYGALTGLSKKMIAQRHGDAQFMLWRRSYTTRPPAVSSFSQHYPGNDERYVKYVHDVRLSFRESLVRSLSKGRLSLDKKLPRTESLQDCMERTIPYFRDVILPRAIARNRTVLIASSENAIRGLLMHLCEIPPERISEIEIPTGLPLIFDVRQKRVRLLDDGDYDADPVQALKRHDFGTANELLFRPCVPVDANNESCDIDELLAWDPIIRYDRTGNENTPPAPVVWPPEAEKPPDYAPPLEAPEAAAPSEAPDDRAAPGSAAHPLVSTY